MRVASHWSGPFVLACAVVYAGCDSPTDTDRVPHFDIAVTGALTLVGDGLAEWHVGTHPTRGPLFEMTARTNDQDLIISWNRGGIPSIGALAVGFAEENRIYMMHPASGRQFIADSGEIVLTFMTDGLIVGSFDVSAFQYCPVPLREALCDVPGATIPTAPRIRAVGTFTSQGNASAIVISR